MDSPEGVNGILSGEGGINLIREKTFTPELRTLVHRVLENEPLTDPVRDQSPVRDRDEILLRLTRLLYATGLLLDNSDVNPAFDPVMLADSARSIGLENAIIAHCRERLAERGFPGFALMSYNPSRKGFVPAISNLTRYSADEVVIGAKDPLFREIRESLRGTALSVDSIVSDPFKEKLFSPVDGLERSPIYFIITDYLTVSVAEEIRVADSEAIYPFIPTGILMLEVGESHGANPDASRVFESIMGFLPIFLFPVLRISPLSFSSPDTYDDITDTYHLVEFLALLFMYNREGMGYLIRIHEDQPQSAYISRYLVVRLSKILRADSAVIHLSSNRIVVLTRIQHQQRLYELLDEYRRLFGKDLRIDLFHPADFKNEKDLVRAIILEE